VPNSIFLLKRNLHLGNIVLIYEVNFTRGKNPMASKNERKYHAISDVVFITPSCVTQLVFFNNKLNDFEWTYYLFFTKENEN